MHLKTNKILQIETIMKKIILAALLSLIFVQLKAQDGVVFKIKYGPNKTYKSDIGIVIKLNANVTGDPGILDKLKSSGITSPITVNMEMGASGTMQTGSLAADGSFPINMEYKVTKLTVGANGHEAPIPPTISEKVMKVAAHINKDGLMVVDSADGKRTDDSTKQKIQQMTSLFQKQIKFPDKALKPGDSFTQENPMNIPLGNKMGGSVKVNYAVTYKLTSIADGKAYFDVTPNFSMDFGIQGKMTVNITGTGTGKLVYSIKDSFPISNTGDYTMTFKVTSPQVNVDATGSVTSNATTGIN